MFMPYTVTKDNMNSKLC